MKYHPTRKSIQRFKGCRLRPSSVRYGGWGQTGGLWEAGRGWWAVPGTRASFQTIFNRKVATEKQINK